MTVPSKLNNQETEVTFARDLGLFDATMIGIEAIQPESGKSWQFLSQYQKTAIANAAQKLMPFFGSASISYSTSLLRVLSPFTRTPWLWP